MVRIITDSTADLPLELAAQRNIAVVPLLVTLQGESWRDGVEINRQRLFELVEERGQLPQTAAPAVGDFVRAFQGGEPVLFIGISSQLSSTIAHARLAAQECDGQVRVLDSLNLSSGTGLLALLAADLRDAGLPLEEIERQVAAARAHVWTTFVIETMRYLHMGGRCTALQSIVGSVLQIRPCIQVQADGTLGVRARLRGSRRRALETLLKDLQDNLPRLNRKRVFVTHSGCEEDAAELAEQVRQLAAPEEVLVTGAGCVISSHCGPDTVGILYLLEADEA